MKLRIIPAGLSLAMFSFAQTPAQTPGVVQAGPGNPYQRAGQLTPRIMDFTATPLSVQAGQSVMLNWASENPTRSTIEPGVGTVTARGNRPVTPLATTTYTLTVTGAGNTTLTKTVTVTVTGSVTPPTGAAAAAAASKETPRRPDGKPDFSGVYQNGVPGAGGRGGAPAGGRAAAPAGPTLKPGAEKYRITRGPQDTGTYSDCMPVVAPQSWGVPYQFQIAQTANHLIIMHEYPGTFRIVTLNGTHPADPDPTWLGDSVGRWEGDTLVVDTVGFNDKTEISGYHHSTDMHLVERFQRPSADVVEYEAVIEDPNVFAAPWKFTRSFGLRTDLAKIDEFVCEHNEDYTKYFEKK